MQTPALPRLQPGKPVEPAHTWRPAAAVTLPPLLVIVVSLVGLNVNYLVFHALAELFSITIAFAALVIATTSHRFQKDDFLTYIAIAIGWVAMIDLAHTMAFKGMNLFPGDSANPATQLWIAARSLQAFGMLSALWFLRRRVSPAHVHTGFGLAVLVLLALIAYGLFPDAYIDGKGLTPFKIYAEYLIILVLAATIWALWRKRALLPRQVHLGLSAAITAMILSEFAFTRYVSVVATANLVGHVLKIIAYWFIFIVLIEWALRAPYSRLKQEMDRYQRAVDGANEGVWEWLPGSGSAYLSPRWKQLLGFEDHELPDTAKESFFDRIHPQDKARVELELRAHLDEHKPFETALRLRHKNDEYHWYASRGQAQWDAAGKPLRMSGFISNIDALKAVEEELQHSNLALRERAKETACLHAVSSALLHTQVDSGTMIQSAVALVPAGWLYPEITCARIVLDGRTFVSQAFRETPWTMSAAVPVNGAVRGSVEVFYLEARPILHEGPFMKEERNLLDTLARELGLAVARLEITLRAQQQTADLARKNEDLHKFNKHAVDRELRMIGLKQEVNALCLAQGEAARYNVAPVAPADASDARS